MIVDGELYCIGSKVQDDLSNMARREWSRWLCLGRHRPECWIIRSLFAFCWFIAVCSRPRNNWRDIFLACSSLFQPNLLIFCQWPWMSWHRPSSWSTSSSLHRSLGARVPYWWCTDGWRHHGRQETKTLCWQKSVSECHQSPFPFLKTVDSTYV